MNVFWERHRLGIAFLSVAFIALVPMPVGAQVSLARNGKPMAAVVVASDERESLGDATGVLIRYLREMTGAEFVVTDAAEGETAIHLGLSEAALRTLPPETATQLADASLEGYAVHVGTTDVRLTGRTPLACRHAVYHFLEHLGCRWLAPPKAWRVIPEESTLSADPLTIVCDPDYACRKLRYSYGYTYVDKESDQLMRDDLAEWQRANRMGGLTPMGFGHTYPHVVHTHRELFDAHPEYAALLADGERDTRSDGKHSIYRNLCYSSPDVADIFVKAKRAELAAAREKGPYARLVSMEPNDGSKACACENCRALGGATDQVMHLANQVARALRQDIPDALVGVLSYGPHKLPPTNVKPEPNIVVGIATAFNRSGYTYEDLIAMWNKQVRQMTIREYFGVVEWDFGMPGRGRAARPQYMIEKIPYWHQHGIMAIDTQFNAFWASFGPATYVATKLLWDTGADGEAIYHDYCRHAYGKAWEPMRDLHLRWAQGGRLTKQSLHEWLEAVNQARRLVQDDSPHIKRRMVDFLAYMHYVVLFAQWEAARGDREAAYAALKPLLAFTWRTRERQMTHAYAIQRRLVNSGAPVLRPLKDGWKFNDREAVWRDPRPIDDAEIVRLFEQDLRDHPPDDRLAEFSDDLVPYTGTGTELSAGSSTSGKTGKTTVWHVLAEKEGQELTIRLTVGRIRSCIVAGPDDEIVSETHRTRAADPNEQSLRVALPRTGRHTVRMQAMDRYYHPVFEGVRRCVAEASMDQPFHSEYWGGFYFYVPKGTTEIIASAVSRLTLRAPSWDGMRNFMPNEARDGAHHIPVGNDDGKLWMLGRLTRTTFYFYNIPPYLARSPDHLLVPAELEPRPE